MVPIQLAYLSHISRISKAATKARRCQIETESISADMEVAGQTFYEV
jgi:hypothetical protein